MYWGGIIIIPFWFLAPNNPFSWKISIWYSFCGIPQKERCKPNLDCHSEGIAKHPYPYKQGKLTPYGMSIHLLTFDGYIPLNWRFFRIHQVRSKHFFFQYVLLNFYFISHSFVYVVAKILFFLRQITARLYFIEITSILESLRCELASLVLKRWNYLFNLMQKYILRAFYCHVWYDLKHYFLFSFSSEQNIHNKITPNAKLPMAYRTVSIKYATEWTMNIRTPHTMLCSVHLQAGWHSMTCQESCQYSCSCWLL